MKDPLFHGEYAGGSGRECRVHVKLYGKKSKITITNAVKELHRKNLKEVEEELENLDSELKLFVKMREVAKEKGIKAVREQVSEEKLKNIESTVKEQEIRLNQLDKILNKRINLGYTVLEMGPEYLHQNPAAQDFKKQFTEARR